jgi:adenine phosphoribosyltransferase
LFYDISPLLAHADAWAEAVEQLAAAVEPHKPDLLVGIESRGFLVAAPLAFRLGRGFVMIRKQGKLPGDTIRHEYSLEYGSDAVEIKKISSNPASASSFSTISWRPAGRPGRPWSCSLRPAPMWSAPHS